MEEGKASVSVPSKKGRLCIRFIVAVAILAAAIYAYSAAASARASSPAIVNSNATTVNGVFIANASFGGDAA